MGKTNFVVEDADQRVDTAAQAVAGNMAETSQTAQESSEEERQRREAAAAAQKQREEKERAEAEAAAAAAKEEEEALATRGSQMEEGATIEIADTLKLHHTGVVPLNYQNGVIFVLAEDSVKGKHIDRLKTFDQRNWSLRYIGDHVVGVKVPGDATERMINIICRSDLAAKESKECRINDAPITVAEVSEFPNNDRFIFLRLKTNFVVEDADQRVDTAAQAV